MSLGARNAMTNYKTQNVKTLCRITIAVFGFCMAFLSGDDHLAFVGRKAIILSHALPFNAWDSVMYGALQQQGFSVEWETNNSLEASSRLGKYDLVAMNLRRNLSAEQGKSLQDYVTAGGSLYITTTPFGFRGGVNKENLTLCGVEEVKDTLIKKWSLLESPLANGLGGRIITNSQWAGHFWFTNGRSAVSFRGMSGQSVAQDSMGNCLGVLHSNGLGRIALLSLGAENYKFMFPDQDIGLAKMLFRNTLTWLMSRAKQPHSSENTVKVNLPRRAEVTGATLDGRPLRFVDRAMGSLRRVTLEGMENEVGHEGKLSVKFKPLQKQGNVNTWLIHGVGEFFTVFKTPAEAAEFLKMNRAEGVALGLRLPHGEIYYRGIPGDLHHPIIKAYPGDYLAEYIAECRKRNIKTIGVFYMSANPSLELSPDAAWVGKDGKPGATPWVCLNNPRGRAHNLKTFRHLVENYKLNSIMLNDNFQMVDKPCYCEFCKSDFSRFCQSNGLRHKDPSGIQTGEFEIARNWHDFMSERTRSFVEEFRTICRENKTELGGWVNGAINSVNRTGPSFDYLAGMIYEVPPYASSAAIERLQGKGYINTLWGMDRTPEAIQEEVSDAIRAGDSDIGMWFQFLKRDSRKDNWGMFNPEGPAIWNAWKMLPGALDAVKEAFGASEATWLKWYGEHILEDEGGWKLLSGTITETELILKIKKSHGNGASHATGMINLDFLKVE